MGFNSGFKGLIWIKSEEHFFTGPGWPYILT